METRKLILVSILIMAVLIITGSGAPKKPAYISKEYEIYGTWVNPDYDKGPWHPKVVIHPNGKIDFYRPSTATEPSSHGEFVITNKWIDKKGNV